MKTLLLFNQDKAEAKTISKDKNKRRKMSCAFSGGFGHVRCISQENDPEGDLELLCFVSPCFFHVVLAGLLAEHFVHLTRRQALASSGGQHEWVEDRSGNRSGQRNFSRSRLACQLPCLPANHRRIAPTTFGERYVPSRCRGEGDGGGSRLRSWNRLARSAV